MLRIAFVDIKPSQAETDKMAMHYHFIGINGYGMKPLACFSHAKGLKVSGCDNGITPSMASDFVFPTESCHSINHLEKVDAVVYSSAIPRGQPELKAAQDRSLTLLHRSELLAELAAEYPMGVAVAGTHGKSTTTSLLLHVLNELRLEPNGIVGAEFVDTKQCYFYGDSPYFVFEADESDGSLIKYKPHIAIVNNISFDHPDHFNSITDTIQVFDSFLKHPSLHGGVVVFWDDENLRRVTQSMDFSKRIGFGYSLGCDVRILGEPTYTQGYCRFKLHFDAKTYEISTQLIGNHNILNIAAAFSTCILLDLDLEACCHAFSSFRGIKRRLETRYVSDSKMIVDDYAHNPEKVAASIQALKSAYPQKKLCVFFEPHRYSRLIHLSEAFIKSFQLADHVVIGPVFSAGESQPKDFDLKQYLGPDFIYVEDLSDMPHHPLIKSCDIILTMGAGHIYRIVPELIHNVKQVTQ